MRELSYKEIEEVSGGFGPTGAVIGAITGGIAGGISTRSVGGVLSGMAFGSVAGFFGGIASASTGFTRYAFGGYSVGTSAMGTASTTDS